MSRGRVDYGPLTRFGREAYARLSRISRPDGAERGNQWAGQRLARGTSGLPEEDLQPPARQLTSQALWRLLNAVTARGLASDIR
jgi:hypothetical protein